MSTSDLTALQRWLATASLDADGVRREAAAELDRLLGRPRGAPGADALILFLAPDRRRAEESLVEALTEVLFLPRAARTEYVTNPLPSPPWEIRRLLLEYAVWSARVDEVLGALTKGFCAARCERLPAGCCTVLGYDMGLVVPAMLRAQELEARMAGWTPPPREETCKYHGPRGCRLRLFKSPACAGMLCDALVAGLRSQHPPPPLEAFLDDLARLRTHVLDREEIFTVMERVVASGRRLARRPA